MTQLFDTFQENKQEQSELGRFRTIRQNLKAENLLSHLSDSHGLVKDQYSHFKAKDGSVRIKAETRAYNVSDFCTKYMGLSWDETKEILKTTYGKQRQQLVQQQRVRQEQQAVNSIVFVSNSVTQGWGKKNPLDESIRLLKHLQRKEHIGELPMALDDLKRYLTPESNENAIHSAKEDFSLTDASKRIMKARETAAQITLTMNDLVASKNDKKQYVDFLDKNSGDKLFRDDGEKIVMSHRKPDINHTATALTLAAEKYGVVRITGTKEFKEQVIDVAVSKDLNIVFADKKMEADFVRRKEELKQSVSLESVSQNLATNNQATTTTPKLTVTDTIAIEMEDGRQYELTRTAEPETETRRAKVGAWTFADPQNALPKSIHKNIPSGVGEGDRIETEFGKAKVTKADILSQQEPKLQPTKFENVAAQSSAHSSTGDSGNAMEKTNANHAPSSSEPSTTEHTNKDKENEPVTLVAHGQAPYQHNQDNSRSYFVELSNGETKWGVKLKDAVVDSGVKIGDEVSVYRNGATDVEVVVKEKDEQGNPLPPQTIEAKRNDWVIEVVEKTNHESKAQKDESKVEKASEVFGDTFKQVYQEAKGTNDLEVLKPTKFEVDYQWDKLSRKLQVTINGESPNRFEQSTVEQIMKKDAFLKNYTLKEVQFGLVDQKKAAGVQPVPKTYDAQANVIDRANDQQQNNRMKQ
ncbi:hypothetical protein THF5G08_470001 [Vibrio jasicida]|nr:hypothetical protein THF5G08_470001 [Vibrio jasicida]